MYYIEMFTKRLGASSLFEASTKSIFNPKSNKDEKDDRITCDKKRKKCIHFNYILGLTQLFIIIQNIYNYKIIT